MRCVLLVLACACASAQTVIDFSYAGYGGGGIAIPNPSAVLTVHPTGGDDTALLQGAIDRASNGAVLLQPGRYRVSGSLAMRTSGVVLRGSGNATIVATGKGRRTLLTIGAAGDVTTAVPVPIADEVVPAGGRTLTLASVATFHPGDRVVVTRPSDAAWIAALKMTGLRGTYANMRLDWAPGSRNLVWDRTIASVDSAHNQITLDAPVTTALERRFGGATVARVSSTPPTRIGVEDLTFDSEYAAANPRDEDHSWIAIAIDHVEDAWVRRVTVRHFTASAVRVGPRARRVTVEDSRSQQPIGEPAGYRRQSFLVEGQQVLVLRCSAENGMNDFASGLLAGGPNVFLDDTATAALGDSGSFESWSSGVLYERVRIDGAGIRLTEDSTRAQGAGWTAANSVIWNCQGKSLEARGPEGADNIVSPSADPLYEAELAKRTGAHVPKSGRATATLGRLPDFQPAPAAPAPRTPLRKVEIVNGRFVVGGKVLWGGIVNDGWWRGQEVPAEAVDVGGVALTRFIPGRTGPGLTEDLPALAARMVRQGTPFYQMIPGLWYDRRRDEHSTNSRPDANVWAPFYEMPWARSGQGTASDGLSKFDLTRFNAWYFSRLLEFGRLADDNGLVLYHNIYNTHNVLEIPPHWVDYPWRPANNINDTGLPEPPPIEPGNHIHIANQVYDISDASRAALHRALILHELDELSGVRNLFYCLGAQFAGPLAFQEFFQDTVAAWEKKAGRTVRLELATSKDITDAILADPVRGKQVAVIDMQYWQYKPDGTLWAAEGGKNLAFREMIGRDFGRAGDTPPNTTPQQVYRQVREYHDRYPDKAIVAWNGGAGPIPVLMAGGAEALMLNPSGGHGQGKTVDRTLLDPFVAEHLSTRLMNMQPADALSSDPQQTWCLADASRHTVLLYSLSGPAIVWRRDLVQGAYKGLWFDPRSGATQPLTGDPGATITKPTADPWLLLLEAR